MKDLLKTVETFLTYSEAKLEELSEKNQELKTVLDFFLIVPLT